MAAACIFGIVISKLSYGQKSRLVILLEVDKDLKVRFYCTILIFCLAICFQVKDDRELLFNVKEVQKL